MDRRRSHRHRRGGLSAPGLRRIGRLIAFPLSSLLDLLYPPACPLCDELLDRPADAICPACRFAFDAIAPPFCPRCGQPGATAQACPECTRRPPDLDRIRSGYLYGGPMRQAIHLLKFDGRRELAPILAAALLDALSPDWDWESVDLLVPVPLHPQRMRQRGFNPAALLTRSLASVTGRPCDALALTRIRPTPSQTSCATREARLRNVDGAFAPGPGRDLADRRIALVDDVVTSGATLDACADALLAAGARSVSALTIARTPAG